MVVEVQVIAHVGKSLATSKTRWPLSDAFRSEAGFEKRACNQVVKKPHRLSFAELTGKAFKRRVP
jgi:hypothetical protein